MVSLNNFKKSIVVVALAASLAACGDNDSNDPVQVVTPPTPEPVSYTFDVTVSNLTAGQPLSPIAVIAHTEGTLWQIGSPASVALETMAEGGDNSQLLALENAIANASSEGPVGPGANTTITLTTDSLEALKLSLATMMVNTNDGFTGLSALDVSSLAAANEDTSKALRPVNPSFVFTIIVASESLSASSESVVNVIVVFAPGPTGPSLDAFAMAFSNASSWLLSPPSAIVSNATDAGLPICQSVPSVCAITAIGDKGCPAVKLLTVTSNV